MNNQTPEPENQDYLKFKEWWEGMNPATVNPITVLNHIEKYFKPKWQASKSKPINQTAIVGIIATNMGDHHPDDAVNTASKIVEYLGGCKPEQGIKDKIEALGDNYKSDFALEENAYQKAIQDVLNLFTNEFHPETKAGEKEIKT